MNLHLNPWRMGINPTPTLRFHSPMHLSFKVERYISSSKISHFLKNKCAIGECFVNEC